MSLGKNPATIQPQALGVTLSSSTYGQTIPVIYGRAKTSTYLIWQANLHNEGTKNKKNNDISSYFANIDVLIGHNPMVYPLQLWLNQAYKFPLVFTKATATLSPVSVGAGPHTTLRQGTVTATAPGPIILAVTYTLPAQTASFNDYGNPGGPSSATADLEIPLWCAFQHGPNPTMPSNWQFGEWYWWYPAWAGTFYVSSNVPVNTVNVYMAGGDPTGSTLHVDLGLWWEETLGNGPEFQGTDNQSKVPLSEQQILYPPYCGIGSPNFSCGNQVTSNIVLEMIGSYPLETNGDANFVDMVTDIFMQGVAQPGYYTAEDPLPLNTHPIQHSLGCYVWPGFIQANSYQALDATPYYLEYFMPNQSGNLLFAVVNTGTSSFPTQTVSDLGGNSWNRLNLNSGDNGEFYWASAQPYAPNNQVQFSSLSANWEATIFEVSGVDALDNVDSTSTADTLTIGVNPSTSCPCLVLAVANYAAGSVNSAPPPVLGWNEFKVWGKFVNKTGTCSFLIYYLITYYPGNITFTAPLPSPNTVIMASFVASNPPAISKPLGNILDQDSLDLMRDFTRANGLVGSLVMNQQQSASDWLEMVYKAAITAPVWSGFVLKSIPYSEVSTIGNGGIYNAPTAAGPVAVLTLDDLIYSKDDPPYEVDRKAQVDIPNIQQVQCPLRSTDYNDSVISQPETASIALFGSRKDSPQNLDCVVDATVARMILGVMVKRLNYLRNTYKFKLNARWKLLEAMDLIRLPADPETGMAAVDVRLTSISEDETYSLDCEAEPFLYGLSAPSLLPITVNQSNPISTGELPVSVNPPVIFEPPLRVTQSGAEIWLIVSDSDAVYAGSVVNISTDGGASYNSVGTIYGNGTTGYTVNDWPAASDPDTTNDLQVDLTESNGQLTSYLVADEDNFAFPCYVAGGTSSIPYELMSYAVATLTATSMYTLQATGSGNHLRRAAFNCPQVGMGVDHPVGSRFAFIDAPGSSNQRPGIYKINLDSRWIGVQLWFKFQAFNINFTATQDLSDVVAYPYTPTGVATAGGSSGSAGNTYVNTPEVSLTRTSPTVISMSAVAVQFGTTTVNYTARTFTIPTPTSTIVYYVTIADPTQSGDTGTTTLTATCQTNQSLVGVPGNTYMGLIQVSPSGIAADMSGPGGWPIPFTVIVGP